MLRFAFKIWVLFRVTALSQKGSLLKVHSFYLHFYSTFTFRLADLTDWSAQGSSAVPVPSLNIYSVGAAATLGAMGLGWYMWSQRPITGKIVPLVDPNMQTRQLPVRFFIPLRNFEDFTSIFGFQDGSRVCKYLKSDALMRCRYADATTLFEAVRRGARVSKNGPMLGYRVKQEDGSEPYVWMHYNEVSL